jgi:hypothetical protein
VGLDDALPEFTSFIDSVEFATSIRKSHGSRIGSDLFEMATFETIGHQSELARGCRTMDGWYIRKVRLYSPFVSERSLTFAGP